MRAQCVHMHPPKVASSQSLSPQRASFACVATNEVIHSLVGTASNCGIAHAHLWKRQPEGNMVAVGLQVPRSSLDVPNTSCPSSVAPQYMGTLHASMQDQIVMHNHWFCRLCLSVSCLPAGLSAHSAWTLAFAEIKTANILSACVCTWHPPKSAQPTRARSTPARTAQQSRAPSPTHLPSRSRAASTRCEVES